MVKKILNNIQSREESTIYYLITFLATTAMSFTFATYVLFLMHKGLDLFQTNLVNAAFMISIVIFEIPTGAYADYFGRKNSVILSHILRIVGLLVYFFSGNILAFIIAEIFMALSSTFSSGALDAWIVDSLHKKGYMGKVDFVFSQSASLGRAGAIVGGLIGAYLGNINLAYPFLAGAILSIFTLVISSLFIHEKKIERKKLNLIESTNNIKNVAQTSIRYGLKHPVVLWISTASLITAFALMPFNMYWTPRLNALVGNKVWLMGWIWTAFAFFMLVGSLIVPRILKTKLSQATILIINTIILAVPTIFVAHSSVFLIVLTGLLFQEVGRGMQTPVKQAFLNKHIPSEQRATIISFDSMLGSLGSAAGLLVLGWVGKAYSIQASWLIASIILLILIPVYIKANQNEKILVGE